MYRKEFIEYCKMRRDEVNKILSFPHNMNKEELEICYKNAKYSDFYRIVPEEEVAQENDYLEYIRVLMRWK